MRISLPGVLFLSWMLPLLLAAQPAPQTANSYVGSETCRTCHPDVWLTFPRNSHFKSIAAAADPAITGCEGCHGPGGNHVAARGGKATIRAFSTLSPQQTTETCLTCH